MNFLYPLFLAAGISLIIPVVIHLFNLRRYKTILFPNTRFLKNIQLNSRKQSKIRYKLLLASRLLFLTLLILAFAQPFFKNSEATKNENNLQIIYIDNSYSMSVKEGLRTLLDIEKESSLKQVKSAVPGIQFLILTNDKPVSFFPLSAEKVYDAIKKIDFSSSSKNITDILSVAQSIMKNENITLADFYYYSDFQNAAFPALPDMSLTYHLNFYGIPLQPKDVQNIYIDTAFLTSPVLQTGKNNYLVVQTVSEGKSTNERNILQLKVNDQVKSAVTLNFGDKIKRTDTLSFSVGDANWQKIELTLNDKSLKFDDTFRVTARSTPNLSVLVIYDGQPNNFIQAAFRAYNGFRINQVALNGATTTNWKDYNLVILSGITKMESEIAKRIADALLQGQNIAIFPGRTNNYQSLNEGLKQIGDIAISSVDTEVQTASTIQQGSTMVKEMFEKLPDNVQLPVVNWHYVITDGLSANKQSVLSFRNGDPFLARYMPSKGQLYICSSAADMQSGNFPGSYFFTPFLYEMAAQSAGANTYSIAANQQQPISVSLNGATERNTLHVLASGIDVIPPQTPSGTGIEVFITQAVQQPAFYSLSSTGSDTIKVALNQEKSESQLSYQDISALKNNWKAPNIKWLTATNSGNIKDTASVNAFPLWKICVLLAVLFLAAETLLLAKPELTMAKAKANS